MGQHEQVAESVNASNHEHLLGVEAGEVQTHRHMAAAPEAGHNLISGASAQIHRHDPRTRGGKPTTSAPTDVACTTTRAPAEANAYPVGQPTPPTAPVTTTPLPSSPDPRPQAMIPPCVLRGRFDEPIRSADAPRGLGAGQFAQPCLGELLCQGWGELRIGGVVLEVGPDAV